MRRGSPLLLVLGLALHAQAEADTVTEATPDSISSYPSRMRHRSTLEEAATVPGRLVYLPIQVTGFGARKLATALWEQRLLDRFKAYLTFADGRIGVRPLANSLQGGGARVFFRDVAGDGDAQFTSTLGASSSKRQHHLLTLEVPGGLVLSARYASEPNESFHGIGHATRSVDRSAFRQRDFFVQAAYAQRARAPVTFSWALNYHSREVGPGESSVIPSTTDVYAVGALAGLDDRVDYLEGGVQLKGVFVDVPGSPTRGNRTRLELAYSQSVDDDEFSHLKIGLLTEQFLELFYRRTVTLQLGSDWRFAPFGNEVPFYDLAELGGTEVLRGFKTGRFRDRGVTYAKVDYKFPVWRLIEGSVFHESGRTFAEVADFNLSGWERSYGGGLRVWVPDGVVFEFAVARSDELTRILFSFDTTF